MKKSNEEIDHLSIELHKIKQDTNQLKLDNTKLIVDLANKNETIQLLQINIVQAQEKCQVNCLKYLNSDQSWLSDLNSLFIEFREH